MHIYSYKAMDDTGKLKRGQMEAHHLTDLEMRLKRLQLDLISGREKKSRLLGFQKKVDRKEIINFCIYLKQLVASGVPLLDSLKDLRDSLKKDRFQEIVSSIVEKIEGGEKFSEALGHYPKIFGKSFINMVAAGEESGQLVKVLEDLIESIKWQDELSEQAKKALTYPLVTAAVITAVVFFLMIYLVPQLIAFIESMEGELPAHTLALIATSDFFVAYWYLIIGFLAGAVSTSVFLRRQSRAYRYFTDRLLLRLPLIGDIAKKVILARFAHYLAMLYASGVTVLRSIEICESISGNSYVERELESIKSSIVNGQKIYEAVQGNPLFPSLTSRMIRVGEMTGELESALGNVAYFYKREVDDVIERIQTLIEPALTGVMGLIIAWIMLSVLGPLYDLMTMLDI